MANPGSTVYNIPVLIKLADNVDTKKLMDAVIAAVNAHPFIKTTLFTSPDGSVRMKRNDDDAVTVDIVKCASLPDTKEFFKPFELLGSKLYRINIFDTAEGKYLFMDIHHIICDGASENILFADIDKAYEGGELQKEKFSGYELALEESKVLESGRRAEAEEYWKSLLASADTECLPKKEAVSGEGAATVVCRGNVSTSKIKEYCEKENLSLNAYFNGVFSFVLGRLAGKEDPSYATVYNGRSDSRIASSVLFAVKTIPVVADISGEREVKAFVRDMQSQLISSMSNDACPFSELSSKYGAKADVMFVYQGDNFVFDSLCGEKASLCPIVSETAKAPVSVTVAIVDDKFEYTVEYKKDFYSPAFASSFADALDACASEFSVREKLKNVCLLTEKGESLYENLNARKVELKPLCSYNFVELHAAEKPDAKALTSDGKTLTFSELNSNANKIANALLKLGLKRGEIVGIVLDRSVFVPAAEIGVMKAGGAFLPTLPSYPDDRIEFCLTDAESPFVITSETLKAERSELFSDDKPYKTLTVEKFLESENDGNPDIDIGFDDLAYCIYTSGSTGKPKGVMVEHRNMTNMIQTHWSIFSKFYYEDTESSALAICSVSFDASIMDIYVPLCGGRHLYIATEEEIHNPLALRDLMVGHNIGTMVSTPSAVSNLVSMPEMAPAFAKMKSLMCGAEVFPSSLYEGLRKFNPELQILNGYGPTECCVCCSYIDIKKPDGITIGKAIGNTELYVVDAYGNVLPPYCVGELLICGEGVGRGYVKLPEKTAKSFVDFKGKRAYHSGDLVRLNGDAEIDFGGRMDNQVKVRGFRVELDEIEKVMCAYNHVKQSKVIVRNNGNEDYLAGYFTADEPIDIDSLTSFMKSALTYYMVPSVMMQLESMPLTPNGKIDKKALPEIQRQPAKKGRRAAKKSLEQRLCEMFADILGSEEVYADDSFFELDGTSLTASKVTMLLMSDGIEVKYGDIFDNPTPESLAAFIESRDIDKKAESEKTPSAEELTNTREALKYNCVKYAPEVKREPLGNVLLTGANGFLGVHVLDELLKIEKGHIWCLVRRGEHESPEVRLKTMLVYYFSKGYEEELKNRITVIEADITDENLGEKLKDIPFDTVINCAACVKHFADDDILERINVRGVENLISICAERNKKLIQISTVSVPGIHTKENYEKQIRMHENELFVIDDMDNKYGISKYQAELRMFDAIEKGLRGKVIRVGNLMGRHSDGEFQANMETNMFLSGIRGFAFMGKYPISHMTDPMRFSPIDCTARAVIMLAGTNDIFTAFNCDNRYGFDEMKIIDACNRNGLKIVPAADEEYYKEFREKLGDEGVNARLNGLAAYDIKDAHAVDTDNLFTTNILYRIGFSWPLVDDTYLDRAINSIMTLDYFGMDENND
ncbi:MAG: amino acid adenylation domain-containing protein [Clostridiales bacterium]|nr:amino acid adenylation domain-containing protein [Candidatus Coliplasma equi]